MINQKNHRYFFSTKTFISNINLKNCRQLVCFSFFWTVQKGFFKSQPLPPIPLSFQVWKILREVGTILFTAPTWLLETSSSSPSFSVTWESSPLLRRPFVSRGTGWEKLGKEWLRDRLLEVEAVWRQKVYLVPDW